MALMNALRIGHVQHGSIRTEHPKSQMCRCSQKGQTQVQHGTKSNCAALSSLSSQDLWCVSLWASLRTLPRRRTNSHVALASFGALNLPANNVVGAVSVAFKKVISALNAHPVLSSCAPPLAMIVFAIYGLVPSLRLIQQSVFKEKHWDKSPVKHVLVSYVRPLLIWMSVVSICRIIDPIVLSSEASQAIKERAVNFVKSLSTVLTFAVCTTNLTHQVQKSFERPDSEKGRNLGIQFISNAVCTSVWVAAVCLFMELLGFSTQKWITAGGLGTVLVTLAGREIFTNFLSSIMIHATRPFIESQWIQTKIEGQEVSGIVEHVGWWSPTIIRGDDREAVHIPNHKFTVSVVRNLSQKTHWRVKTHLAISHLDAGKINVIVADMRKVLAKHSQVEHKRLHRRVFLDYIHPESQALHILISCFVKTSHFEEYLKVKESILLDLLKVISHHNARLAIPIRSLQRASVDDSPQAYKYERPPLLMSESSVVIDAAPEQLSRSKSQGEELKENSDSQRASKPQLEGLDSMGLNSNDITLLGAAFGKPPVRSKSSSDLQQDHPQVDAEVDSGSEEGAQIIRGKIFVQDDVKDQIVGSIRGTDTSKMGLSRSPSVQDNLVLGVALDGSKRTLPLDSTEKEIVRNGEKEKNGTASEK